MMHGREVSTIRFGRRLLAVLALGTVLPCVTVLAQTATVTSASLQFNPAPVGVAENEIQQLTATFSVTGASGGFTPTAKMQYGLSYSAGAVTCTAGASADAETCSVPVSFQPQYPGGRADAVLLMNGTSVLATALVYGVGQAPMSLIQPGVITNPPLAPANGSYYNSVVGEDGTAYVLSSTSNTVTSITSAGVVNVLPITGLTSPHSIAVDGSGTLYIAQSTYADDLITYSAANGQGTRLIQPTPMQYTPCSNATGLEYLYMVATGITGDLFIFEDLCQKIFKYGPSGFVSATSLNPSLTQPVDMITDSSEDLFIGGNQINELTPAGSQTQVNTAGAGNGIAVDAAGTLYVPRYSIYNGVALLPASGYTNYETLLDASASPLGVGLGPDGTLYVGNSSVVDKVDRSQGALVFGAQSPGNQSSEQTFQVYNGGNEPLTVSGIVLSGTGYTLQTAPTNPCSNGLVLAPGALCNQAVTLTPPSSFTSGYLLGTVTVTTNSLNAAAINQTVALSGYVDGGIDVSVSPSTVAFGHQAPFTTSAAQTVTLTNNGMSSTATIGAITLSDPAFTIVTNNCTAAMLAPSPAAGSSCQLTITFSPTATQAYTATGSFTAQASNSFPSEQVNFNLTGTAMPPPLSLAFKEVIHVTDTPVETESVLLPINEVVHVTDAITESTSQSYQTIDFTPLISPLSISGGPYTLQATASSGLPIIFRLVSGPATISGNQLTLTGPGAVVVEAYQTGNAAYFAAEVMQTVVAEALPVISLFSTGTLAQGTTSSALAVTLTFNAGFTLSSLTATTHGATGSDFAVVSGGTCQTGTQYSSGQSCTVNVTFTPSGPGLIVGQLTATDTGGNVQATANLASVRYR